MSFVRDTVFVLITLLSLQGVLCWDKGDAEINTVYLISSCHLDVGFADTAANIVNEYFDKYFPDAIKIAQDLRKLEGEERLVFTTHPFLVYLYTNCPVVSSLGLHCPNQTELDDFTEAVKRGDIVWHAFPFNAQMEFYDATLADFGFHLTHKLDAMFGRSATTTMSQRDVPGTTRSLIPIMERNGVKAITVGVNTATMPPAVPNIFNWKDPTSGKQVIAMWHPHGYGGQHGPISLEDMVVVPELKIALAFAIRGDNSGPPSVLEVLRNYAYVKVRFPNATIIASGYDEFVEKVLSVVDKLPTYSQEIGDTWIHGIASDPYKTAASRVSMRQLSKCLHTSQCSVEDPEVFNFAALLLKNGEHTWGKDVKKFLHDTTHWSNTEFHSQFNAPNFQDIVNSWVEQRKWGLDVALGMLGDKSYLKENIQGELDKLAFDGHIDTSSFKQIDLTSQQICGNFKIGFSSQNSAINHLEYLNTKVFATEANPLAQVIYQTYTAEDFKSFLDEYVYDFKQGYIFLDLGKPGLNNTEKFDVSPTLKSLWLKETEDSCVFLLEATFDTKLVMEYGAPQIVCTQVEVPKSKELSEILITLYFVNKTATRIPESLSLYFNPSGVDPQSMRISKLGEYVGVLDVIKNGSKHLHACDDNGLAYNDGVKFQSNDTALACIGYPTPFPVPMETPDVSKGFSFSILNNIWGTNYVMWYPYESKDLSSKYRFRFSIDTTE